MIHFKQILASLGALLPFGPKRASAAWRSRRFLGAVALSGVFSACLLVGQSIRATDSLRGITGSWADALRFFGRFVGLSALLYLPLALLFDRAIRNNPPANARAANEWHGRRRAFLLMWAGIVLCWLPYYLAFFPGCMTLDSMYQLEQALGVMPLNDWHPLLHTAVIAFCVQVAKLFGAPQACVAMYSAMQMLIMSAVFAGASRALLRHAPSRKRYAWLMYAWFALFPMHPMLCLAMWKDILHAGVTLLLIVSLFSLARDPGAVFRSRRRMAALALCFFLFATLRHNGLYACLLYLPCFLWHYRAHWKSALPLCLTVIALTGVYRGPALQALNPLRGSVAEFLSAPVQFIARVAVQEQDSLPPEDASIIGEILPYERMAELYNPRNADPVKSQLDTGTLRSSPWRYAALFSRLAVRYPQTLLESFLCGTSGYWDPAVSYDIAAYGMMPNSAGAERRSIGIRDDAVRSFIEDRLRPLPGISLLFGIGGMIWLIAAAAVLLWVKRRRDLLIPFALLFLLWLTVLASPIYSEYRYAYGLVVSAPFCLGVALSAAPAATPRQRVRKRRSIPPAHSIQ